jgi:hypothetical protein
MSNEVLTTAAAAVFIDGSHGILVSLCTVIWRGEHFVKTVVRMRGPECDIFLLPSI